MGQVAGMELLSNRLHLESSRRARSAVAALEVSDGESCPIHVDFWGGCFTSEDRSAHAAEADIACGPIDSVFSGIRPL